MADITRRRTGELLRKLFEILLQHLDGMSARDALVELEAVVQLTEYEKGNYESGERRFEKIIRFATVDCVKAGWLIKDKGRWTVTDAGKEALQAHQDAEAFYPRAAQLYRVWKASLPDSAREVPEEPGDPDTEKKVSVTFEQAEEQAWSEIEQYLRGMHPYDFQELVADLLRAMGYYVSWVAPPGKDGGVDILAHTDPLGNASSAHQVSGETPIAGGAMRWTSVVHGATRGGRRGTLRLDGGLHEGRGGRSSHSAKPPRSRC